MQFTTCDGLMQVFCPLADTAAAVPGTGQLQPTLACVVYIRRLCDTDRDALVEMIDDMDDWGERVRWIFAETVCDERGVLPTPQLLADTFGRFNLRTTELVHRNACSHNGIPYLPYPTDEPTQADQPA